MARILIAEPANEVRILLELVVSRLGHEPVLTASGLPDVDAALIEPAHPGNLALAASLRRRAPSLPLVFVSIQPKDREADALDPVAFLLKPFPLADLEEALKAALALTSPAQA